MGQNQHFEDGDDRNVNHEAAYPTGPIPPHERIWRHPSELGFAAVAEADSAPVNIGRTGRSLLGVSTVGAVILMSVLFVAIQPTSPVPDAQDAIALTNSELRIASFDHVSLIPLETPSDATNSSSRRVNKAVGIMLPNGRFLITTMAAIAEVEAIDVRLTNGRTVRAQLVQTYPELSIAVLSLSEQSTSTAFPEVDVLRVIPRGAKYFKGQVVMVLVDVPRQLTVSDQISDVLVSLQSKSMSLSDMSHVSEGTPIFDQSGQLVGLCTHIGGVLGFIPFIEIEQALVEWIKKVGDGEQKK